jgi:hypothetical protein
MVRNAVMTLALILPLLATGSARAQDDAVRAVYASMAQSVQQEYEGLLASVARGATGGPNANAPKVREMLKMLYYNKAALFAVCAAEAERIRSPRAERVPAQENIMLTTCVEEKFGELNTFTNTLSYAGVFFPDRIESCGEKARLHEREKALPPYDFLHLAEPKLYDFARYNKCLMTKE